MNNLEVNQADNHPTKPMLESTKPPPAPPEVGERSTASTNETNRSLENLIQDTMKDVEVTVPTSCVSFHAASGDGGWGSKEVKSSTNAQEGPGRSMSLRQPNHGIHGVRQRKISINIEADVDSNNPGNEMIGNHNVGSSVKKATDTREPNNSHGFKFEDQSSFSPGSTSSSLKGMKEPDKSNQLFTHLEFQPYHSRMGSLISLQSPAAGNLPIGSLSSLALPSTKEILRMRHMSLTMGPQAAPAQGALDGANKNFISGGSKATSIETRIHEELEQENNETRKICEEVEHLVQSTGSENLLTTLNSTVVATTDLKRVKLVTLKGLCKLLKRSKATIFIEESLDGDMKTSGLSLHDVTHECKFEFKRANAINDKHGVVHKAMTNAEIHVISPQSAEASALEEQGGDSKNVVILVPVTSKGNVIGIAEVSGAPVAGYSDTPENRKLCLDSVEQFIRFAGIAIENALNFRAKQLLIERRDVMLNLTYECFSDEGIHTACSKIVSTARELVEAARCSIFVVDELRGEFVSVVVDNGKGIMNLFNDEQRSDHRAMSWIQGQKFDKVRDEIRFSIHIPSIASEVYKSSRGVNIHDAYEHDSFNKDVDRKMDFRTRSVLCWPLFDISAQKCIGVIELINKTGGSGTFTVEDETLLDTFSIYFSYSLKNATTISSLKDAQLSLKVANERRAYWAGVKTFPEKTKRAYKGMRLDHFNLNFLVVPKCQYTYMIMDMMEDKALGIPSLQIDRTRLLGFIHGISSAYRELPYHNWAHGFQVTQWMYACIKNVKLSKHFTALEKLCLLIACLCHDVDHRGQNNAYQVELDNSLAQLYVSSTLERHHCNEMQIILNFPGNDFVTENENIDTTLFMTTCEHLVIATDLKLFFKNISVFKQMTKRGFNPHNQHDRDVLLYNLMTASDVSSSTKPWDQHKEITTCIYEEFFHQGDLERANGLKPMAMYDRYQAGKIPNFQVGFMDAVARPVYEGLELLDDSFKVITEMLEINREKWIEAGASHTESYVENGEFFKLLQAERLASVTEREYEWAVGTGAKDSTICMIM